MPAQTVTTAADLVILSVLAETPRHGYDLNAELERRDVRDWVGVSRPQVYYSLRKLAERELIASAPSAGSGGPERQVYTVTEHGLRELASALGRADWSTARPHQPFVTWLAMSRWGRGCSMRSGRSCGGAASISAQSVISAR